MTVTTILNALEKYDGIYKREELDLAIEKKEEITPHLLDILDKVNQINSEDEIDEDYFAHMYALYLLGHFKEPTAHDKIISLFSKPEPIVDALFGDTITQDLPVLLYETCHGNFEKIFELAANEDAYSYCRASAAEALVFGVVSNNLDRTRVVTFFNSLLLADNQDPEFLSLIVSMFNDIYPEESADLLKKLFDNKSISTSVIDYDFITETLQGGKEKIFDYARQEMGGRMPDDFHDRLSWWACFNEHANIDDTFDDMDDFDDDDLPSIDYDDDMFAMPSYARTLDVKKEKIGRNEPCPCGSGKKYKKCCLGNQNHSARFI